MNEVLEVQDVIERLRDGDDATASELFGKFALRLTALARQRLGAQVQRKVAPEDVIQSVFRSFFMRNADGDFDLPDWDSLWSLLTVITVRKCAMQGRYFHQERRDVRRELSETPAKNPELPLRDFVARNPTPLECVVIAEAVDTLVAGLSERDAEIVQLRLNGFTYPEIAERAGCASRTVRRTLTAVRARLLREMDEEIDKESTSPALAARQQATR